MVTVSTSSIVRSGSLWMQCPANDEDDVHPGLAFVYPLDQLIVAKKRDNLHDVISKSGDAFTIFNSGGQKVFLAVLNRRFKQFDVKIFNNYGNEVLNVQRPFNLCTNKVLVCAPHGNLLGTVLERPRCTRCYIVKDETGKKIFKIRATGVCRYMYEVCLFSYEGPHTAIGSMQDNSPAVAAINFGVSFPKETNVKHKVVLLGACFLIWPLKC